MSPLEEFQAKVEEYRTNNITALMGTIQVTSNEREDLKLMYGKLEKKDQVAALAFLNSQNVDLGIR
jgi:hypothetical protein